MQRVVKESDIREEIHYAWECPECHAINVEDSHPVGECSCYYCCGCFEVTD